MTRHTLRELGIDIPIANAAGSLSRPVDVKIVEHAQVPTSLQTLKSPILPELLPDIFLLVINSTAGRIEVDQDKCHLLIGAEKCGHVHHSGESSFQALLKLGQVCRLWRRMANTTPFLWSQINFSVLEAKETDAALYQESIKYSLLRTRNLLPLDMTISLGHKVEHEETYGRKHIPAFMEIMDSIVCQQWRVKYLSADIHICSQMTAPPQSLSDMPLLEKLVFRSPVNKGDNNDALIEISLNRSPLIRHLHLDGDFLLKPITQALPNLTVVRMFYRESARKKFPSVADCISLLQSAPALETLQVDICSEDIPSPDNKVDIVSKTLRTFSLRVNDDSDEAARYLLDILNFPNLVELELDIGRSSFDDAGPHTHILGFLERCGAPLNSFAFCSEETDEDDVMSYLRLMPRLRKLRLVDVGFTEDGINSLVLHGKNSEESKKNVCPKLESLSFVDAALRPDPLESADAMAFMVMSRWLGASGNLKEFMLLGCGWRGFATQSFIQRCIRDGLKVVCK
ncbi:hypothetical protein SCHPADRAFT_993462 [Schizopora paradoxa]|uniref:F-box domain-containing protein n=1 Tax=Schizopora paradoxa TaxID=27342 RepID=A0A0H2SA44_9AGAM|nr:hypothetical protein SCHPADRAFT_993462 [Schizopora paradoxa]